MMQLKAAHLRPLSLRRYNQVSRLMNDGPVKSRGVYEMAGRTSSTKIPGELNIGPFSIKPILILFLHLSSTPLIITDCQDRVIAVKAAQPSKGWEEIWQGTQKAMLELTSALNAREHKNHGRGPHSSFSMGLSHGGGQKVGSDNALPFQVSAHHCSSY